MPRKLTSVRLIEREQPGSFWCEKSESCFAEGRLNKRATLIIETYETSVKRCVPVRGQQQSVVDIQSLVITAAVRPCNDVTGAQQRFIINAGKWAAPAPIVQQCSAEIALPYPFLDDPIDLGVPQTGNLGLVLSERKCGQTARQMKSSGQG